MTKEDKLVWKNRDKKVERVMRAALDEVSTAGGVDEACLMHVIRRASQSAERLSNRVAWLNIILVVLGALGLAVAAYGVLKK